MRQNNKTGGNTIPSRLFKSCDVSRDCGCLGENLESLLDNLLYVTLPFFFLLLNKILSLNYAVVVCSSVNLVISYRITLHITLPQGLIVSPMGLISGSTHWS